MTRITCISDTHGYHNKLQLTGGDILIHAGDQTLRGTLKEAIAFLNWLEEQPYKHKVIVPGNHDWIYEEEPKLMYDEAKARGISLLIDDVVVIDGQWIWGSPITPTFYDWAFMRDRGEPIKKYWDLIPAETNILVTHGPPWGIGDYVPRGEHAGCLDLLGRTHSLDNLKLHVFGHIHEGRGIYENVLNDNRAHAINACVLDGQYKLVNPMGYNIELK